MFLYWVEKNVRQENTYSIPQFPLSPIQAEFTYIDRDKKIPIISDRWEGLDID